MLIEPAWQNQAGQNSCSPFADDCCKNIHRFSGMNKHPIFITIEKKITFPMKIFYHENAGNAAVLLRNIYQLRPTATSGSAYR